MLSACQRATKHSAESVVSQRQQLSISTQFDHCFQFEASKFFFLSQHEDTGSPGAIKTLLLLLKSKLAFSFL